MGYSHVPRHWGVLCVVLRPPVCEDWQRNVRVACQNVRRGFYHDSPTFDKPFLTSSVVTMRHQAPMLTFQVAYCDEDHSSTLSLNVSPIRRHEAKRRFVVSPFRTSSKSTTSLLLICQVQRQVTRSFWRVFDKSLIFGQI